MTSAKLRRVMAVVAALSAEEIAQVKKVLTL